MIKNYSKLKNKMMKIQKLSKSENKKKINYSYNYHPITVNKNN